MNTLKNIVPQVIRDRVFEYSSWFQNMIDAMKIDPIQVSEYCQQVIDIDHIDENFHILKDNLAEKEHMF